MDLHGVPGGAQRQDVRLVVVYLFGSRLSVWKRVHLAKFAAHACLQLFSILEQMLCASCLLDPLGLCSFSKFSQQNNKNEQVCVPRDCIQLNGLTDVIPDLTGLTGMSLLEWPFLKF